MNIYIYIYTYTCRLSQNHQGFQVGELPQVRSVNWFSPVTGVPGPRQVPLRPLLGPSLEGNDVEPIDGLPMIMIKNQCLTLLDAIHYCLMNMFLPSLFDNPRSKLYMLIKNGLGNCREKETRKSKSIFFVIIMTRMVLEMEGNWREHGGRVEGHAEKITWKSI